MKVKKISTAKLINIDKSFRPQMFDEFIGQKDIIKVLKAAIQSAKKRETSLGHILFSGESGYGKTTLAQIIARQLGVNIKIITGYALTKPAEIISLLNNLKEGDILFIDEIHRLKPNLEEILYIAMEDFAIDMIMPEGNNVRVPLDTFTLIGATTRLEALSQPMKNRFVYKFHFEEYTKDEKINIIKRYLKVYGVKYNEQVLGELSENIVSVPREISNSCIKIRDYLISTNQNQMELSNKNWQEFKKWARLQNGGLNHMHQRYLEILKNYEGKAVGLKTIALQLGLNEKSVEEDVEPLLLKLGIIEKTGKGRRIILANS